MESNPVDIEFFRALNKFIAPQIDHLAPIITDFYNSRRQKYIIIIIQLVIIFILILNLILVHQKKLIDTFILII